MAHVTWDQARIETLKKLWASGLSASECASRMGIKSRSAIIGKVHRLSLPHRKTTTRLYVKSDRKRDVDARENRKRRRPKRSDGKMASPVFSREPLPPEPVKPDHLYSLAEIADREEAERVKLCRFIYGDPKGREPWGYCGCVSAPESSYCAGHHNVVWRSLEVKRTLDRKPMFVCTTRFGHAKEVAV